jgi:hypothetical protein
LEKAEFLSIWGAMGTGRESKPDTHHPRFLKIKIKVDKKNKKGNYQILETNTFFLHWIL